MPIIYSPDHPEGKPNRLADILIGFLKLTRVPRGPDVTDEFLVLEFLRERPEIQLVNSPAPEGEVDQPSLEAAAIKFAEAWRAWHEHTDINVSDEIISSATEIIHSLGLEMVDDEEDKPCLRPLSPTSDTPPKIRPRTFMDEQYSEALKIINQQREEIKNLRAQPTATEIREALIKFRYPYWSREWVPADEFSRSAVAYEISRVDEFLERHGHLFQPATSRRSEGEDALAKLLHGFRFRGPWEGEFEPLKDFFRIEAKRITDFLKGGA